MRARAHTGLSEVLGALGTKRLETILPDIVANAYSSQLHVREGCLSLFVYLPNNFKEAFTPFLQQIVPPILKGEGGRRRADGARRVLSGQSAY